jgi:hypothetical protein
MPSRYQVLILGASYGSLLATKIAAAGHAVRLVCLPDEAKLFNRTGARIRMPVKGRETLYEIDSRTLPGRLSAGGPAGIEVARYDLVALAMQEPQYRAADVRVLLAEIARARLPCLSIMNMPPIPYLARIPGLDVDACRHCYTDPTVWGGFEPGRVTLCSPDPQAFRPPGEELNVLQVRLATNFKAARFESPAHTAMVRDLASQIDLARFRDGDAYIDLPVKLRVHESLFVPLAKWSMLLTGNYRCVQKDGVRPIRDAVHSDLEASKAVYAWVGDICKALGASESDLVPFDKYAAATLSLVTPSSAARALANGATQIERADRLVQTLAATRGMRNETVDRTVALVDDWLEANRRKAAAAPA